MKPEAARRRRSPQHIRPGVPPCRLRRAAARRPRRRRRAQVARIIDQSDSSLLDVLDNLLNRGVVLNADVILALANVDLVYVRLSALLCAADRVCADAPGDMIAALRLRAGRARTAAPADRPRPPVAQPATRRRRRRWSSAPAAGPQPRSGPATARDRHAADVAHAGDCCRRASDRLDRRGLAATRWCRRRRPDILAALRPGPRMRADDGARLRLADRCSDEPGIRRRSGTEFLEQRRERAHHEPPEVEVVRRELGPLVKAERVAAGERGAGSSRSFTSSRDVSHRRLPPAVRRQSVAKLRPRTVTVTGPWPAFAFAPELF